MIVKWGHLMLR